MLDDIKKIADHYGKESQIKKTLEEARELCVEMMLAKETEEGMELPETAWGEVADVMIMCEQLIYLFGKEKEVNIWAEYKIQRQLERIRKEEQDGKRADDNI